MSLIMRGRVLIIARRNVNLHRNLSRLPRPREGGKGRVMIAKKFRNSTRKVTFRKYRIILFINYNVIFIWGKDGYRLERLEILSYSPPPVKYSHLRKISFAFLRIYDSYSRSSRDITSIENLIERGAVNAREKINSRDKIGIIFLENFLSSQPLLLPLFLYSFIYVFPKVRNEISIDRKFLHLISCIVYILSLNFVLHIFFLYRLDRVTLKYDKTLSKDPSPLEKKSLRPIRDEAAL